MLNDSLKSVIDKLHELSGELMEQSGGVDKDGVFLDPCNGGVNKILNRENFYNPISHMVKSLDEKNSMNRKAAVLLKNSFLVDEAPLSVEKIKNKTTLEACLYLLSVENRILVDIE